MAAIALRAVPADTVATAARRALDVAKGDVKAAAIAFEREVGADAGLFRALMQPLVSMACYDAVRKESQRDRRTAWKAPVERLVPSRVSHAHRVVRLAAGTLLMFPLPGGKKLGEATRDEIGEAATFYETQAGDVATKARWLRLVAQSVPGEKVAGDVLSDRRLRELQELAREV